MCLGAQNPRPHCNTEPPQCRELQQRRSDIKNAHPTMLSAMREPPNCATRSLRPTPCGHQQRLFVKPKNGELRQCWLRFLERFQTGLKQIGSNLCESDLHDSVGLKRKIKWNKQHLGGWLLHNPGCTMDNCQPETERPPADTLQPRGVGTREPAQCTFGFCSPIQ